MSWQAVNNHVIKHPQASIGSIECVLQATSYSKALNYKLHLDYKLHVMNCSFSFITRYRLHATRSSAILDYKAQMGIAVYKLQAN